MLRRPATNVVIDAIASEPKRGPQNVEDYVTRTQIVERESERWGDLLSRVRVGGALPMSLTIAASPIFGSIGVRVAMAVPDVRRQDVRPMLTDLDGGSVAQVFNVIEISRIATVDAETAANMDSVAILAWAMDQAERMYKHEAREQFRVVNNGEELRPFEPTAEH